MRTWNRLSRLFVWRHRLSADDVARQSIAALNLPVQENSPGLYTVTAKGKHGYDTSIHTWGESGKVTCMASIDLRLRRSELSSELALTLLEQNESFVYGSFRVIPIRSCRTIALSHTCELRYFDAKAIGEICGILLDQMQKSIRRLYATELIPSNQARLS